MRLHTTATESDLTAAASLAGVDIVRRTRHRSSKSDHAFEVTLRGSSKRRPGDTLDVGGYAATWDQWGVFLGHLYRVDDAMVCGSAYKDRADFDYQTGTRFADDELPADMHGDHRWIVGRPFIQECAKCSAVRRWGGEA